MLNSSNSSLPSSKLVFPHPGCSNRHFRIYTVVFERHIQPLVYCQDLSLNGTFLNGKAIGKNNAVLLSDCDELRNPPDINVENCARID